MNTKNTLVYGFAAFAAWFAWRSMGKPGAASVTGIFDVMNGNRQESGAAMPQNIAKVKEVLTQDGSGFGNGWRYFDDGTAIDPQGSYYLNGQKVWSPV